MICCAGAKIVLTPVRIQRGNAVRAKLAQLGLADSDVADAVRWARKEAVAHGVAEPQPGYGSATGPRTGRHRCTGGEACVEFASRRTD